jgi:KaiC/GvpD/RAD55 family RecA-like ATPase
VRFDLPELDTLLAGSLGTGKTLLALDYTLAGARAGEPVIYLGFARVVASFSRRRMPFRLVQSLRVRWSAAGD